MTNILSGEWIADLGSLTCRNSNTRIIVEFQKSGKTYIGKIKDIPVDLSAHWSKMQHGEGLIRKAVREAEDVFLRAYVEKEIDKKKRIGENQGG